MHHEGTGSRNSSGLPEFISRLGIKENLSPSCPTSRSLINHTDSSVTICFDRRQRVKQPNSESRPPIIMGRRSLRQRGGKKPEYAAGDKVELTRNGDVTFATLVKLVTEDSSPNPRWLVDFSSGPEEVVYEHTFLSKMGEDVATGDDEGDGKTSSNEGSAKPSVEVKQRRSPPPSDAGADSDRKGVAFSDGSSSVNGKRSATGRRSRNSVGTNSDADRVSAREARSRRRQALIDEPVVEPAVVVNTGKRKATGAALASQQNKQRKRAAAAAAANNKNSNAEAEETVTKVKFLTGTLYIHRGTKRRVEFVRRV